MSVRLLGPVAPKEKPLPDAQVALQLQNPGRVLPAPSTASPLSAFSETQKALTLMKGRVRVLSQHAAGSSFLDNLQDRDNWSVGCFRETLLEAGEWKEWPLQSFSKNEQNTSSQHSGVIALGESDPGRQ